MSASPPVSPRENRRANELAQRREDALSAASAVFAAKGYHDAQMTEIAAAAELSRASLYSMFTGKEELYQQVISTAAEAVRDAVHESVEALDDPGQQLLCVIDSLFSCYEENQDLLRIYVLGTQGMPFKLRQAMGDEVVEIALAFSEWVAEIAKRAKRAGYLGRLDPETVGVSLVGAVTKVAADWIEMTPERPLSQAAPAVRAIFEQLLGARGNS
jgi:AcrR family transcriptional regulator